ncbi:MAG: hypothetical protein ACR2P9_07460 [Gammaproteobacteria bacterium]
MMTNIKTATRLISTLAACGLLAACLSSPTVPSSSGTSSPSSGGTAGGPTSGTAGAPSSGTAGLPSTSPPAPPGGLEQQGSGGVSSGQSGQPPAAPKSGQPDAGQQAKQTGGPGGDGRTDDEILADALEAFKRDKGQPPVAAGDEGDEATAGGGSTGNTDAEAGIDNRPGSAGTGDENTAQLDGELDKKFAKFDRLLLRENEAVRDEANREGAGGSLPPSNAGGSGLFGDEEGDLEALRTANTAPPPTSNSQRRGEKDMNAKVKSESVVPPDLASTEGDDVIARQLREAAMKEPDPELREKLWDEYRKYKKNL